MPLVLAVRRLPYTVRGAYSSLLLVHRSHGGGGGERGRLRARAPSGTSRCR